MRGLWIEWLVIFLMLAVVRLIWCFFEVFCGRFRLFSLSFVGG